jgi:hypothetical protein
MLIMLVAGLFLLSWWRLAEALLLVTYASIRSIAGKHVAIKQGVLIGLLFPLAVSMMQFTYVVAFG